MRRYRQSRQRPAPARRTLPGYCARSICAILPPSVAPTVPPTNEPTSSIDITEFADIIISLITVKYTGQEIRELVGLRKNLEYAFALTCVSIVGTVNEISQINAIVANVDGINVTLTNNSSNNNNQRRRLQNTVSLTMRIYASAPAILEV